MTSPSESAVAKVKFRAVYYMQRHALAPSLLGPLLEASRLALNVRPSTRPMVRASGAEAWFGHQPYVGLFLYDPGELVNIPAQAGGDRSIGFYLHPTGSGGHVVYDVGTASVRVASTVFDRVPSFLVDALRTASSTASVFAPGSVSAWARDTLGVPRWVGDDLGLFHVP